MSRRIVIVGAGFAGLSAAIGISADDDVTVVSDQPWCEFLPNIHELLSSRKRPTALRLDAQGRIQRAGHRFVLDEIVEIDVATHRARGRTSGAHEFDALIVAVGGVNATHGVDGADRHALPFKSVGDCARIRDRLQALAARSGEHRVVIVGGGLEGVEALGEILRAFPRFHIELIEGGPRLLPTTPRSLDRTVRRECAPFDVTVHVETRVEAVHEDAVLTADGAHIPSDLTIWTGGPTGSPLLASAGLTPSAGAWAPVHDTLEASAAPGVFVAGDAAQLPAPISKQAYHAIDMGTCAAANAIRRLEGRPLEPFSPSGKPMLISFGHLGCFLVVGKWALFGPAVSLAKEGVFQLVAAQLVPPLDTGSAAGLWDRFAGALPEPGWPGLSSLIHGLVGATDLRVLPPNP